VASPNRVGLVVGTLIGGWHLFWSILVLVRWARPIIDFIFWAHMIQPVYIIKAFNPLPAITLIVVTSVVGYIFGFIGGLIWNKLHRQ
jgi:hypothetical protein